MQIINNGTNSYVLITGIVVDASSRWAHVWQESDQHDKYTLTHSIA